MKLINDAKVSKGVPLILSECLKNSGMHIFAIGDSFEQQVKNLAIERSSTISYENKQERFELYKTIVYFNELECIRSGIHKNNIDVTRAQLQHFEIERYRGAIVRSTKIFFTWRTADHTISWG